MTTSVNAWRSWHLGLENAEEALPGFSKQRQTTTPRTSSIQPASLGRTFTLFLIDCTPPRLKIWDLFLELAPYAKNSTTGMGSRLIFRPKAFQRVFLQMLLSVCSVSFRKRFPESEKHSGVVKAEVRLVQNRSRILVSIRDEGKGFDARVNGEPGLGIRSTRERARLAGGHSDLFPARKGTRIEATVLPPIGG